MQTQRPTRTTPSFWDEDNEVSGRPARKNRAARKRDVQRDIRAQLEEAV